MRLRHTYSLADYDAGIALAMRADSLEEVRMLADLRDATADMLAADDAAATAARDAEKTAFDAYFDDGAP